jgi:uncharacterized small protein (DUF1192 family)
VAYFSGVTENRPGPLQTSIGVIKMSKAQKNNKEDKKQPAMTPKEKKAAKKAKKDSRKGSNSLFD